MRHVTSTLRHNLQMPLSASPASLATPTTVLWFKRDLRWHDHAPLASAALWAQQHGGAVLPLWVDEPAMWAQPDMAAQVGTALKRIMKLLGEAGAGPEHIVRLTWYLTSRSEYEAAGAGIGAAWKETLGRNFPPSTLLYIDGLVDVRAKVELEVTAYVPKA